MHVTSMSQTALFAGPYVVINDFKIAVTIELYPLLGAPLVFCL